MTKAELLDCSDLENRIAHLIEEMARNRKLEPHMILVVVSAIQAAVVLATIGIDPADGLTEMVAQCSIWATTDFVKGYQLTQGKEVRS